MEKKTTKQYEVIAKPGKEVFGHFQGERFWASLNEGEEYALLRGGFIAIVEQPKRQPFIKPEPSKAPEPEGEEE